MELGSWPGRVPSPSAEQIVHHNIRCLPAEPPEYFLRGIGMLLSYVGMALVVRYKSIDAHLIGAG